MKVKEQRTIYVYKHYVNVHKVQKPVCVCLSGRTKGGRGGVTDIDIKARILELSLITDFLCNKDVMHKCQKSFSVITFIDHLK